MIDLVKSKVTFHGKVHLVPHHQTLHRFNANGTFPIPRLQIKHRRCHILGPDLTENARKKLVVVIECTESLVSMMKADSTM